MPAYVSWQSDNSTIVEVLSLIKSFPDELMMMDAMQIDRRDIVPTRVIYHIVVSEARYFKYLQR